MLSWNNLALIQLNKQTIIFNLFYRLTYRRDNFLLYLSNSFKFYSVIFLT